MWHTGSYTIAAETYDHLLPITEDDLHLVKYIYENHEDTDPAYITTYFQKKTNGECFPKTYVFHCEFWGNTTNCDRVEYRDNLQDDLEYCLMWEDTNPAVSNSTKRKYMYRNHIFQKHGRLGAGNQFVPHECVMKLVRFFFQTHPGWTMLASEPISSREKEIVHY